MKRQTTGRILTKILVVFCSLSICSIAVAQNVNMKISGDKLVITSQKGDNGCSIFRKRGDGCVKAKKGQKIKINMNLTGSAKCNLEYGTDWELNAVYLGGYDASDKPINFGFGTTDQADYDKVKKDFGVADRATGRVNPVSNNGRMLTIKDDNQAKYVVWYKVEAKCERSDGEEAYTTTTDPRIRNGGTN